MSDLVEKVGRAIRSRAAFGSTEQSRAAIAAAAEWLDNRPLGWPPSCEGLIATMLRAQLEQPK